MEKSNELRKNAQSNQEKQLRRRTGKLLDVNLKSMEDSSSISTYDDCLRLTNRTENDSESKISRMFTELTREGIGKTTSHKMPTFMINKRSLSESSAQEANRSCATIANNSSLSARKMCQNELSLNPDSVNAQPSTQLNSHEEFIDNKNERYNKSHYISDTIDVGIRIALAIIFIKLETTSAFQRNIHVEELWLYKNPRTDDIVTPRDLILSVILSPLLISILHYLLTHDRRDFRAASWAWTLSLCLNGLTTSLIKITSGRPRPDFFYRCFPDGQMMANVTPTAVNFNCTGEWRVINEGYKSFPSGHSSFAFCSFGFIAFYLAGKLHAFNTVGRGETWRLFTAIAPLLLAMLIGISRTCDYHHHWQDVTVGAFIGLAIAYITYRQYYPSIFSRHSHRSLPRDECTSICNDSASCFKNEYLRLRSDDYTDDLDCEINTLDTNGQLKTRSFTFDL